MPLRLVKEYSIGEKIGYFQLDNATNNDTAVAAMDSILENEFGENVSTIKLAERRLCCFGHILNLAARHLLFSEAEYVFGRVGPGLPS